MLFAETCYRFETQKSNASWGTCIFIYLLCIISENLLAELVDSLSYKSVEITLLPCLPCFFLRQSIGDKALYYSGNTAIEFLLLQTINCTVGDKNSNQWYYRSSRSTVARNFPCLFYKSRDGVLYVFVQFFRFPNILRTSKNVL